MFKLTSVKNPYTRQLISGPSDVSSFSEFTSSLTAPPVFFVFVLSLSACLSLSPFPSDTVQCLAGAVLRSFWCPSKRGTETHGCCVARLLCAKRRALVHDNKGEDEGAHTGGRVSRADTPVLSPLLFALAHKHTHTQICACQPT